MAIDAQDGKLCESFGTKGTVNLLEGLGSVKPGFYLPTSAPLVARNLIIVGGFIADNQEVGEPSGVVRAYDVATGALVWAWDLGNPEITKEPPPGQTYTRGTPNMWTTASADEKLGLVYLPLGNATPDLRVTTTMASGPAAKADSDTTRAAKHSDLVFMGVLTVLKCLVRGAMQRSAGLQAQRESTKASATSLSLRRAAS